MITADKGPKGYFLVIPVIQRLKKVYSFTITSGFPRIQTLGVGKTQSDVIRWYPQKGSSCVSEAAVSWQILLTSVDGAL
jgi:hypothetical protein